MLENRLGVYMQKQFGEQAPCVVSNLVQHNSGWENDVYSFQYAQAGVDHNGILRMYQGARAAEKARHEYAGMQRLRAAGYPVPQMRLLEPDSSVLGKPFVIMEKISGATLAQILREAFDTEHGGFDGAQMMAKPAEADVQSGWGHLTSFCELLVKLHSLDWRDFTDTPDVFLCNPYASVERFCSQMNMIASWCGVLEAEPVLQWLQEHQQEVPCARPSVMHWDYHPDNVLFSDEGTYAVIDWTQIEVGDCRFDVAWTLMICSVYSKPMADFILETYERLAGQKLENLAYFEVAVLTKRLLTMLISFLHGPAHLGMRPDSIEVMATAIPYLFVIVQRLSEITGRDLSQLRSRIAGIEQKQYGGEPGQPLTTE